MTTSIENEFGEFMSKLTGTLHDYQILFAGVGEDDHQELWDEVRVEVADILSFYYEDGPKRVSPTSKDELGTYVLNIDNSSDDVYMEREFAKSLVNMFETFKRKHHDYGRGNISALGERGVYVRLFDKLQRMKQLVWLSKKPRVKDESILDTYLDISVYGVIGSLLHNGVWPSNE